MDTEKGVRLVSEIVELSASAPLPLTPENETLQWLAVIACGIIAGLALIAWLAWKVLKPDGDKVSTDVET